MIILLGALTLLLGWVVLRSIDSETARNLQFLGKVVLSLFGILLAGALVLAFTQ